jgi:ABC-type sugar transport system permease subunit
MNSSRLGLRLFAILLVVLISALLRVRAVSMLPIDFDEDDYLRAGQQYAAAIRTGAWADLTRYNYRQEHPPLQKIAYGLAIASLPPAPEIPDRPTTAPPASELPEPHLTYARMTAAVFGVLETFALALLSPLAGLVLAVHTWDIKYVSQVQVEALPAFTSALCVLAYYRSHRKREGWLLLSAIMLGLTAAGKYIYCVVGLAVAADWSWSRIEAARPHDVKTFARVFSPVAIWGFISFACFFAADPYLWPDPVNRLRDSVVYHAGYAQSEGVIAANYPMWQPLVWLFGSVPWHPGVFLIMLDMPVAVLAVIGFPRLWQKFRVFALWFVMALSFLLLWTVKWPQYVLTLSVPLSLAAGIALRETVGEPVVRWLRGIELCQVRLSNPRAAWRETRFALPWLLPGMIVLALITLFPLFYQAAMSVTDFSALAIKDGLNGGVLREAWHGLTGQADPVQVALAPNGRVSVNVVRMDRGEPRPVSLTEGGLASDQVHYAGPGLLVSLLSGMGADVLVFEIIWTVLAVGLQTVLGVVIALVLNQRGLSLKRLWRSLFILPWAIPEFVGALFWLHIFEPDHGWLALALHTSFPWAGNPQVALGVLLIAASWLGFPLIMLAATAGLTMIPAEVYDAVAVDGANRWQQFRYVTFPLLLPLLTPVLILRAIFAFNQFYLFYVMSSPYPLMSYATISFYLFNVTSGQGGQFAVSAAINIFTVLILLFLLVGLNRRMHVTEGVTFA